MPDRQEMAAAPAEHAALRRKMVARIRSVHAAMAKESDGNVPPLDDRVLTVMSDLPRHAFVPEYAAADAHINAPLAIGYGQTISQPFIVALMTSLSRVTRTDRVLEVGTGSGYQTAVLAALAAHVYSIEARPELLDRATGVLRLLGITNVSTLVGDGYAGCPSHAPFDAIVVTAAPIEVPAALVEQLRPGGRLVIPYGNDEQTLTLIEKSAFGDLHRRPVASVRFVPLVPGTA